MKNKHGTVAKGGVGFVGLLQLVFIVLKLFKVLEWNWAVVLLPLFISVGLISIVVIAIIIFALVTPYNKL